jgi:hypothetical protein
MFKNSQCDVCGRRAKYHDTSMENGVTERHLCGVHGQRMFLSAMKDVLASQVKHLPANWRATHDSDSQLTQRIVGASSLGQIGKLFRLSEVAASLRTPPPVG